MLLPELARTLAASTAAAVGTRIGQVAAGAPPARELSTVAASNVHPALPSGFAAREAGTLHLNQVPATASLVLPLQATSAAAAGTWVSGLSVWGSGDYRNLAGGDAGDVAWDGQVVSAHLGADTRLLRDRLLVGLAGSFARGTFSYADHGNNVTGTYQSHRYGVHPYAAWISPLGLDLWASAGYGWGAVEIDDSDAEPVSSAVTQLSAAAGASGTLLATEDLIAGGTTRLRLKGDAALARSNVAARAPIAALAVTTYHLRLILAGSHVHSFAAGGDLTPAVEVGVRHDGDTGSGVEVGASLGYRYPPWGLMVEAGGRFLVVHSSKYHERGVSGAVRVEPGAVGRGLSLSLQPAWGLPEEGFERAAGAAAA